ncbi:MAG TPA: hypothetical protein VK525_02225 [Candidatus Saccharimonadales bacterium]|nr:hypothetical protein [Candidatus Saccharimonadales bacterium]
MRPIRWMASFLGAAIFVLAGFPVLAQSTDPVADAARKAREDKKAATTKPKKVYTEDDIPARKAPDATTQAQQQSAGNADGAADASATPSGTTAATPASSLDKEEAMWRKKFADAHAKLAALEKELDVLQREAEKAQVQYYPDPQKAMTEQNTRKEISDKNTKIEAKKQEIAAQKQAIADMEDDLRKSGGDSGWAR